MQISNAFVPELQSATARPTLFFLVSSGIAYVNKTTDPWFSATQNISVGTEYTYYVPDEPATVVGCASERRFCNPRLPASEGCLDLYASGEAEFAKIFPDAKEREFLRPLSQRLQQYGATGMYAFHMGKSVPSLLARQTLDLLHPSDPFQAVQTKPLPPDQWQQEMEYTNQATLSAMQHSVVDYARGSWLGDTGNCEKHPCRRLCHSQVSSLPEVQS